VAYYRVSTDKQGQSGLGLDAQRAAVELHARSVGAEVVAEFQDVESGRKANRTGLAEALETCHAKRATLLIAKLDRLARSVAFISSLMEGGVDFVAADMLSVNRLTVHVLAAVAEHEREMISQRTKAALAAAKVRGTRLGNPRLPPTGTLAATPAPATSVVQHGQLQRRRGQSSRMAPWSRLPVLQAPDPWATTCRLYKPRGCRLLVEAAAGRGRR
jgi:DNA invertase Pin-like site-specific DNA recombinase